MNITEIRIKNFRSFGSDDRPIKIDRLTTIIGANSSGKTALIHALLKLFGVNPKDRQLLRSDFHVPYNKKPEELTDDKKLSIEVKIEFPELMKAGKGDNTVPSFFKQMMVGMPKEIPYLRIRLEATWSQLEIPEGEIETKLFYVTVPYGDEEKEESLKPVPVHDKSLIQMVYVPAVREPASQLKNASGTILWRLLKYIAWPENTNTEIQKNVLPLEQFLESVGGLKDVGEEIQKAWNKYHRDPRYRTTDIQFSETSLDTLLKNINIRFSPTEDMTNYSIDQLGDGLRSLFYISLVSTLLEIEQKIFNDTTGKYRRTKGPNALTILAVEEPENHISPHLLGRITANLRKISIIDNAQVIITSHSASIVRRIEPEEIRHAKILTKGSNKGTTSISEIKLPPKKDEAHKYVKEAVRAYPELYFAQLVILGEGDSEELIIPRLLEVEDIILDDETISVVPLGGRYVNHFWRLLNQLDIPHVTLLDLDRERGGGDWTRIKYAIKQLLENGADPKKLLLMGSKMVSKDIIEVMHKRTLTELKGPNSIKAMENWIKKLESYNVFFSSPIDIDFLMLQSFTEEYKTVAPQGPDLPDRAIDLDGYNEAVSNGVRATLKKKKDASGFGYTFSDEEKELMLWYNTLFLGRSKPSTHIEALVKIESAHLSANCPKPLKNAIKAIKKILEEKGITNHEEKI